MEEILQIFSEVAKDPLNYGRRYKATSGKKIVGYVCTYVPEELILAAGAHPLRLFGTKGELGLADAHLQSYCCSLVRGIMEEGLKGGTDFLDGVIFPHTCDSIQRLSDLWRMNVPKGFHLDAVLPVKLHTESARSYFIAVLERLRRDLERELKTRISDDDLYRACELMNEIRKRLQRIYELRCHDPSLLAGDDLYNIVKGAMIMDRLQVNELLSKMTDVLAARSQIENSGSSFFESRGTAQNKPSVRLIMAGGICNHTRIQRLIEEAGGTVIWDDLCTGSRYFAAPIAAAPAPLEAIADRYMGRAVCPAKHAGLRNRAEHIVSLVQEKQARGVVFLHLKFCDPHAFDYPYLRSALEEAGIPSLLLEVEDPLPAEGQLRTRFEAFLEML